MHYLPGNGRNKYWSPGNENRFEKHFRMSRSLKTFSLQTLGLISLAWMGQGVLSMPWWIIFPIGIFSGVLVSNKPWQSFLAGFSAIFLLWTAAAIHIDLATSSILSKQIGELFGGLSPVILALVSGATGGIVGGLSVLTGALLRGIVGSKR